MIIYVKQPGCSLRFRGKTYRTPIKFNNVSESEKKLLLRDLALHSISNFEIIDSNKSIPSDIIVENKMKNFLNISPPNSDIFDNNVNNKILKSKPILPHSRTRVVKKINNSDFDYHKSIENEPIDIDIDLSSDDILQQLLDKL